MRGITIKILRDPRKILIVKPSSLGDIVHSLPFLNCIKERYPKAEVHWVVANGLEDLLIGNPMVQKIWVINKDIWKKLSQITRSIREIRVLLRELRRERYDIVIDLQGLLRSGIITRATGSRVRIGFKEAREGSRFFYTLKIAGGKNIHAVDRYLRVAASLGCDIKEVCFPFPLSFTAEVRTPDSQLNEDYAVVAPGARWKTKRWSSKKFGELASHLPIKTVVIGGRGEKGTANEVVEYSKGMSLSLAGKTDLKGLIEIIKGARFMISNDSGPMHIAAALGIPVFAIFGPTDPARTGPYGEGHTIIRKDIPCSPCFKKKCNEMKCMKDISVEKVYGIIKKELDSI
ncbi:MAG: lipopolysaccharide heptosyltransferase II [Nitrospirae bacterium]|nr:lipopolysaccharide heptosyltransferase II [Nitrospirota bacterium]